MSIEDERILPAGNTKQFLLVIWVLDFGFLLTLPSAQVYLIYKYPGNYGINLYTDRHLTSGKYKQRKRSSAAHLRLNPIQADARHH